MLIARSMSPDPNSHRGRNRLRLHRGASMLPDVISTLWSDTRGLSMSCLVQEMSKHCTLQTQASHTADPGVAHRRPRHRTPQTQASHTADPGVAHRRPRHRTPQTQVSHTAEPIIAHCRSERRPNNLCVRNLAVHKRIGVQVCL